LAQYGFPATASRPTNGIAHAPEAADRLVETPSGLSTTANTSQLRTPSPVPTRYGFHDRRDNGTDQAIELISERDGSA
jgi:hypothetical protein